MSSTVVIVDDTEPFRRSARGLLELDGYVVIGEAADGASALDVVARLRPDVVLLDIALPDMSGLDIAERLAADAVTGRARLEQGSLRLRHPHPAQPCRRVHPQGRALGDRARRASRRSAVKGPKIAIAAAGLLLGVVAFRILRDDLDQSVIRSLPAVAIGWSAIASGLIAWTRRPINRLGPLLIAYGLAVLVRPWQYSDDALMFTLGYALSQLNVALFGHVTLAYPTGRVTDRLERAFVRRRLRRSRRCCRSRRSSSTTGAGCATSRPAPRA